MRTSEEVLQDAYQATEPKRMITLEELARIRAIAEADKNGADGKAWDEAITPDIVIALCDRIEKQQDALNLVDMALSAVRSTLERYK